MSDEQEPLLIHDCCPSTTDHSTATKLTLRQFINETVVLFKLAWPVSATNILQFSITSSSVFFLGHLGTDYLGACSLAIMLINVTGNCFAQGTATALDTLCSQAFTGSPDPKALGKHLQRGIIVSLLFCLPITLLWIFSKNVFLAFGQDEHISELAGVFLRYAVPGLFPMFVNECLRRYLQTQGIMKPGMYITFFAAVLAISLQWYLISVLGYLGAPIATAVVNIFMPTATIFYIAFIEGSQQWGGFNWDDSFDWPQIKVFIKLAIPGIIMISSEWLAFEAVALAAGILGNKILAAQTVVLNTATLLFMIPLGISVATTTRVGNSLGAGKPEEAKLVTQTALALALFSAFLNCTLVLALKDRWGLLFTADQDVVELVSQILPLLAVYQIYDTTGAIGGATIRGCGLQHFGAYINLSCYYLVGIPLGLLLAFRFQLNLFGLWIGIITGLFLVSAIQLTLLYKLDWENETIKARRRVNDTVYESFSSMD